MTGVSHHTDSLIRRNLFENEHLKLEFDEETFRFSIKEPEKEEYDFNTLSSGYAAALGRYFTKSFRGLS